MKALCFLPLLLGLPGCMFEKGVRQISVDAEAQVEVAPDSFRMIAVVRARGGTQDVAMSVFSETLDRVTTQLPNLEGLDSTTVEPSSLEMRPIFEQACEGNRRYNEREACTVEGYIVEATVSIEGSPATVAGNMFSLASDLGAEEIDFDEYFLADPSAAERAAEEKAFEKAEAKARRLASAANVTLLAPSSNESEDVIIVTGSRLTPRNILAITPPPITIEREVSVTFAIE